VNQPSDRSDRLGIEQILLAARNARASWLRRPTSLWIGLVIIALTAATLWIWTGRGQSAISFVTEPVVRDRLLVVVTATGSVQPITKVDVSSELSGTMRKVLVDYNSVVTAGQVLAELDTDKLLATVRSSRAKLASTRAKVADARAAMLEKEHDLARKKVLAGRSVTSAQDLELAQTAYERAVAGLAIAEAEVGIAEAELQLNETNLAKARIVSPIGGVILKRNVDPGQTVASSFQAPVLFTIAEDLTKMELQVDVDEADVGKVKAGQSATFSVDAYPERRFPAVIRDVRFASETIQGVVTYKAVLTVDNSELLLRPGMTATAEIRVTEIPDALLIPNAALRYSPPEATTSTDSRSFLQRLLPGPPVFRAPAKREEATGQRTVWLLKGGLPTAVAVSIGASDGRRTEIRAGPVNVGDTAIIDHTVLRN